MRKGETMYKWLKSRLAGDHTKSVKELTDFIAAKYPDDEYIQGRFLVAVE